MRLTLPLLIMLGCDTDFTSIPTSCDVEISSMGNTVVEVGDRVEITGQPLTTHFDTAAYLNGVRATVLNINRESCTECDECRDSAGCSVCQDCDACDTLCEESCEPILSLRIPELSVGSTQLQIYNSYGQSNPLQLFVAHSTEVPQPLDTASHGADTGSTGAQDTDSSHKTESKSE